MNILNGQILFNKTAGKKIISELFMSHKTSSINNSQSLINYNLLPKFKKKYENEFD